MLTAPYFQTTYEQQNVVAKYGYGTSNYSYNSSFKVFSDDQLRVLVDIICDLIKSHADRFAQSISAEIMITAPTGAQIHQLFLDHLLKHEQK